MFVVALIIKKHKSYKEPFTVEHYKLMGAMGNTIHQWSSTCRISCPYGDTSP